MATLTTDALVTKWQARFADNVTRNIDEGDFREFTQDIVDSFSSVFGGPTAIEWLNPCEYATTTNITLSGEQNIDGVLTSASRVLVRAQTIASQNGIYVSAAGAWTRATDADSSAEIEGAAVGITSGDTLINSSWIQTTTDVTIGVSNIVWHQIGFGVSSQNLYQVLSEGNSAFGLTIEDVADPVNDQDAATKAWVLSNVSSTLPDLEIEEVTATTYAFVAGDRFKIKMFTNVAGCTATVPVGLDTGWAVAVYRPTGAGVLTLASAGTYRGLDTTLGTEETWATITHIGSNVHSASGALGTLGLSIGTIDSQTKSSNGLVLSGSSVYAQTADATSTGMITAGDQTIGGIKSFNGGAVSGLSAIFYALRAASSTGLKIANTSTTGGSMVALGEESGLSSTPFYIIRYGSAHATKALAVEIYNANAGYLEFGTNGIGRLKIDSAGVVSVATAPTTSNSGNSILARNSTTGALELRSDVVVTSGAQTIAGVKTFSSTPLFTALPTTSNSGNSILARNTTTGALELRSDVVVTSGAQTIAGVKTFSSTPLLSSAPSTSTTADVIGRNTSTGALERRTDILSGTDTPTITAVLNCSALSASAAQYMRVGNTVTVSGRVSFTSTASGILRFRLTLPVASNFVNQWECGGNAIGGDATFGTMCIDADTTNNAANFSGNAPSGAAWSSIAYHYTYQVI